MRDVSIVGIGQTAVGEHWETSLRHLAFHAIQAAAQDAGHPTVEAMYIGNMLGGQLSRQLHLGPLLVDFAGMTGIEAIRVEAADASGGAAFRQAYLAVAGGAVNTAIVVGVEKFTDVVGSARAAAMASTLDADYEGAQGATPVTVAALLMQRYMHEYGVDLASFAGFSVNAHANGALNPNAMYRNRLKPEGFSSAPVIAPPISLFDAAPEGDGAAAVIVTTTELAQDLVPSPVRIMASAAATEPLSLHDRANTLHLQAAATSTQQVLEQAGIGVMDIDLFELHDAFTILAALSLEAAGFAKPGEGTRLAVENSISRDGTLPIATFGGLKARGHAGGATGIYQIAEVALQLRGKAGDNQIPNAHIGMTQNLGGLGGTAITHILEAID
jgi:acetyl-CoA C-acetyltransferase